MSAFGRFCLALMLLFPTALLLSIAEEVNALPPAVLSYIGVAFGMTAAAFVIFGGKE